MKKYMILSVVALLTVFVIQPMGGRLGQLGQQAAQGAKRAGQYARQYGERAYERVAHAASADASEETKAAFGLSYPWVVAISGSGDVNPEKRIPQAKRVAEALLEEQWGPEAAMGMAELGGPEIWQEHEKRTHYEGSLMSEAQNRGLKGWQRAKFIEEGLKDYDDRTAQS